MQNGEAGFRGTQQVPPHSTVSWKGDACKCLLGLWKSTGPSIIHCWNLHSAQSLMWFQDLLPTRTGPTAVSARRGRTDTQGPSFLVVLPDQQDVFARCLFDGLWKYGTRSFVSGRI